MPNIRQSQEYASFMEKLGWKTENLKSQISNVKFFAYIKEFPIIGSFIKILRPKAIPTINDLKVLKKYRPFKIQIEPDLRGSKRKPPEGFFLTKDPLIPSKSILIDLKHEEEKIFSSFSEEKRRAVRRAIKNKIVVNKSDHIEAFIRLKNQQLWPFGFLLNGEIKKLWEVFHRQNKAKLLLAYKSNKAIAGVLLLFSDKISYYWLASSLKEGKKLFAPSLLVWEAIKLSKQLGYKIFDFEGIEDDRFPKTKYWRGFSKFKKGFGGKEITYCNAFQKLFLPIL